MFKKRYRLKVISVLVIVICTIGIAQSTIQSNVAKGKYIPKKRLTVNELKSFPIPSTGEDYALLNSQEKITSIVLGSFRGSERKITLIQDRNADGKVDIVAHWFVDNKRYRYESKPGKKYSPEKFKKLIQDILYGRSGEISPNSEGLNYYEVLKKNTGNISRWKNGYTVSMNDSDALVSERIRYYFANNGIHGYDLVFHVKYTNLGPIKVSPIINYGVYANNSKDPIIIETVKGLLKDIQNYTPRK